MFGWRAEKENEMEKKENKNSNTKQNREKYECLSLSSRNEMK